MLKVNSFMAMKEYSPCPNVQAWKHDPIAKYARYSEYLLRCQINVFHVQL